MKQMTNRDESPSSNPGVLKLIWLQILWAAFGIATRYLTKQEEPSCRDRANRVREVVRVFRLTDTFPEIFDEVELCPQCEQARLVFVHPGMVCDYCWLAQMKIVQDYLREYVSAVNRGVPPEEVRRSLFQRFYSGKPVGQGV
jgi:hypothetical protein